MSIFRLYHLKKILYQNNSLIVKIGFFCFVLLLIHYQVSLLSFKEWGDESETIVAANMIKAGYRLYNEIFEPHGPLIFLPGLFLAHFGGLKVLTYRIFIALFQLFAIFSIFNSPLLGRFNQKIRILYFIFASSFLFLYYPKFYSHTFLYQNLTGILLVFILTNYTLPSIANLKIKLRAIIIGNSLIASIPFLGISFIPLSFFLFFASIKREYFKLALIVSFCAFIINVLFIVAIGSIKGFYTFHIYLNTHIVSFFHLSIYYPKNYLDFFYNIFKSSTTNLAGVITLIWLLLFCANIFFKERFFSWKYLINWRSIFLILGLLTILARGSDTHGLPYYYACLVLFSTMNLNKILLPRFCNYLCSFLLIFILLKFVHFFESDRLKFETKRISYDTDFSRIVKSVTEKNDKVIAYSWQNFEYIASDRLPISGAFTYFPWQVKYSESPIFGLNIDGCRDIELLKPKVMLIDKLNVYGMHPWSSYGSCIDNQLKLNYKKVQDKLIYIRKDIAKKYLNQFVFDR